MKSEIKSQESVNNHKIALRVLYSLSGNILRAGLSFATGILIARGLGPESFGTFGFLLASFTALTQLLDLGTSNAFATFISKRNRTLYFIVTYCVWILIQFSLLFVFIFLLAPDSIVQVLWQGQHRELVTLAFVAVFLQQKGWTAVSQIGESQRFTKHVQSISVLIALIHFIIVLFLLTSNALTIDLIYFIIIFEFSIGIAIALFVFPLKYTKETESIRDILKEYKKYCLPLIPNAWIMMICMFADTWILQFYGGAVEQAYYVVAMQFSVICLIATRSILSIMWKEVAETYSAGDIPRVKMLFSRSTRWLHGFGASIACLLIPWTSEIIDLSLGKEYAAGSLAMAIMFLYPIDQARGQVAGTMLLAMEFTKVTLIIGVFSSVLGLFVTYFLVASPTEYIPGLGLGATGLALKMVLVQFLVVNISIWWVSRILGSNESNSYQYVVLAFFLLVSFFSYHATNYFFEGSLGFKFLISSCIYGALVVFLVSKFPSLFLIEESQIVEAKRKLCSVFNRSSSQ